MWFCSFYVPLHQSLNLGAKQKFSSSVACRWCYEPVFLSPSTAASSLEKANLYFPFLLQFRKVNGNTIPSHRSLERATWVTSFRKGL